MIAFRLLLLVIAVAGTASAVTNVVVIRSWFAPASGLLLVPSVWLLFTAWNDVLDWWRLQIMTPAIIHEASIASANFAHGRRPFGPDTTLWKEP